MSASITKLYPRRIREGFRAALVYSTSEKPFGSFMALVFGLSIMAILGSVFGLQHMLGDNWVIITLGALVSFIIVHVTFYSWLVLSADSKGSFVDSILPEALRLISSNLRSGSTVERALLQSAREEFGPLQDAIYTAGKEIATGETDKNAFMGMTRKIKSENLERGIDLIVTGINSGGQLAGILENISDIFRDQDLLKKEMRSNVLMYAIFIFMVIGFGAPILFGISDYLINVTMHGVGDSIPNIDFGALGGSMPVKSSSDISQGFMEMYFVLALILSSFSGSIVLGQVLTGKDKSGIKYVPIMIALSIVLFFVTKYGLSSVLAGTFV